MQKVTVSANTKGNITLLSINGKCIAHIGKDCRNIGRFGGRVNIPGGAVCVNSTYPEALEFITGAIERHFAAFGLDVEFTNA